MKITLGGIEAGGTKFVCAVGTDPDHLSFVEFPTTNPEETIERAVRFFRAQPGLDALGIASFGPADVNPGSPTFGYIKATPKLAWRNFDFGGALRAALQVPIGFDTDVNAAALAEHRWGAATGVRSFVYVTVGTGVGGGAIIDGRLIHGRQHPEMGHVRIPRNREIDPFPGACPYHGDCLEGLIAGPVMETRTGRPPHALGDDDPAWGLLIEYLALGLSNWICTLSPERVVLGGGIMQRTNLLPRIQARVAELLNGYIEVPEMVPPGLGRRAGVLGAIALAEAALHA